MYSINPIILHYRRRDPHMQRLTLDDHAVVLRDERGCFRPARADLRLLQAEYRVFGCCVHPKTSCVLWGAAAGRRRLEWRAVAYDAWAFPEAAVDAVAAASLDRAGH